MPVRFLCAETRRSRQDAQALLAEYAHARGLVPTASRRPSNSMASSRSHLKTRHRVRRHCTGCSACRVRAGDRSGHPRGDLRFRARADRRSIPKASTRTITRRRRAAIASRLRTRSAIGDFIGPVLQETPAQASLLEARRSSAEPVICRSSQARRGFELQADFSHACFAVHDWPRKMVSRPARDLRRCSPSRFSSGASSRPWTGVVECQSPLVRPRSLREPHSGAALLPTATIRRWKVLPKPFAESSVSPIAMRIRLEKLGLLHRAVPLTAASVRNGA